MHSIWTQSLIRVLAAGVMVSAGAVPALAQGGETTSPRPDFASCDPGRELAQSAAPSFSVPLDLTDGLIVGRSHGAPFTASARAAAMLSVLPRTRRLLIGPMAGLVYTNPDLEGLLGARVAYRIWSLGLRQGLDLGTRGDVVLEGGWETGGTGVASAGFVVDLSLLRLVTRATYDITRDDVRLELGAGRALLAERKDPLPTVRPPPSRWHNAQVEFQAVVRTGVARVFNQPEPADTTVPPWERAAPSPETSSQVLCDREALRRLARRAPELEESAATLDDIVRGFRRDSLLLLVAKLEAEPQRWQMLALQAAEEPPPAGERSAVQALMQALRRMLVLEYGVSHQ
jgi:hypothetical protein